MILVMPLTKNETDYSISAKIAFDTVYAIINTEDQRIEMFDQSKFEEPKDVGFMELMKKNRVTKMVCKTISPMAHRVFTECGIKIYAAAGMDYKENIEKLLTNELSEYNLNSVESSSSCSSSSCSSCSSSTCHS